MRRRRAAGSRRGGRLAAGVAACGIALLAPSAPAPTVFAGDRDRDGRFTGRDVELALEACAPGCRLRALPVTYHDVAVVIPESMTGSLVFEGAGMERTLFLAPVPQEQPVFRVQHRHAHVTFRDFAIDGRKGEQVSAERGRFYSGITVNNPWARDSGPGLVERVEIANLMGAGVGIAHGRDWTVAWSRIHDIGCSDRLPCPALAVPDPFASRNDPTWQASGSGIVFSNGGASGGVAHHNEVWNIVKVGIEAYSNDQKPARNLVRDFHFHDNHVEDAGGGIVTNGGVRGLIENNVVENSELHGFTCGGVASSLTFAGNVASANGGYGMFLSCLGSNLTVADNTITENCTSLPNQGSGLHLHSGPNLPRGRNVVLRGNVVAEPSCASAALLTKKNGVTVEGNQFLLGSQFGLLVYDVSDVVVRDTWIAGSNNRFGILLLRNVDGFEVANDVAVLGSHMAPIKLLEPATLRNVHIRN